MQDIRKPDASFIASAPTRKTPRHPQHTCDFFRVSLESQQALSVVGGHTYTFHVNAPQELQQGRWCVIADNVLVAGTSVLAANKDAIVDFHVRGLPLRHSYDCSADGESTSIACIMRSNIMSQVVRDVTRETLGVPLMDLGQLRQRPITVTLLNGDGVLHDASNVTHWRMSLCFYLLDSD